MVKSKLFICRTNSLIHLIWESAVISGYFKSFSVLNPEFSRCPKTCAEIKYISSVEVSGKYPILLFVWAFENKLHEHSLLADEIRHREVCVILCYLVQEIARLLAFFPIIWWFAFRSILFYKTHMKLILSEDTIQTPSLAFFTIQSFSHGSIPLQ